MNIDVRMEMSEEEKNIAAEFGAGWSDEKIATAHTRLGPAAGTLLPAYLSNMLKDRAKQEGTDEVSVLRHALEAYLIPR
ncbi:hypothetical protein [Actinomyces vulturis]|uniref:hypothetical protein n=1 Tax=Actinomyces vulturis TaxID=1857645 RepID=UPI0008340F6D|nr:hypothetical protein [Actinomyces vulturis]